MINILVVDPASEYGSLIKGVLMSRHFGISVSTELSEAKEKLDTGLFDIICVDCDTRGTDKFITETKQTIPNTPIITLSEKADESNKVFRVINKPISLAVLVRSIRESVTYLEEQHYQSQHKGLVLPVEITAGKSSIRCRLSELGLKGAMVAPEKMEPELIKQFADFFLKGIDKIMATILGKKANEANTAMLEQALVKISSRLAYRELTPDSKIKSIGLNFLGLNSEEKKIVEELLAVQAA